MNDPLGPAPLDFATAAGKPLNWLITSNDLRTAGDRLWAAFQTQLRRSERSRRRGTSNRLRVGRIRGRMSFAIPCMLYGLAFENALKALRAGQIVAAGGTVIVQTKKGERLHSALTSHNLVALAREGGLELSKPETNLLERLEKFAVWAGRYPLPVAPPADTGLWIEAWRNVGIGDSELSLIPRLLDRIRQATLDVSPG